MLQPLRQLCKRSLLLVSIMRGLRFGREHFQREKRMAKLRQGRSQVFSSYLSTHAVRKLQIGTQEHVLPGWLNTDLEPVDERIAFLDAREPFPFDDATFDCILWEHCIEHITYLEALAALREIHRVLKPGGRVRIATPNLNRILGLFDFPRSQVQERYIRWYIDTYTPEFASYEPGFVVNNTFRLWGHQFIYDPETLQLAMKTAGFPDLQWCAPGESNDENLRGIDGHAKRAGEEMNRFESMVVEAVRPIESGPDSHVSPAVHAESPQAMIR